MKAIRVLATVFFLLLYDYAYGQDSVFSAFETKEFETNGRQAKIVFPKKADEHRSWIWRARFWAHEPQTDIALLERGFHVVYIDVAGLFGNEKAVSIWNGFYHYVVNKYNLNKKVALEGMSRGGLIVYNWAAQNTPKVACIYADAPVCDINSWPRGMYAGAGSETEWAECLQAHGLNEETVLDFKGMPVYTAVKAAEADIPVLHVCGDSDKVVPYKENTAILAERFRAAGGSIEIIIKEGIGHHPHSLENPKPIVDFILENTSKKN